MRCAVFSDLHANLPAFDAALADMAVFAPDCLLVAGDLFTGGPYPLETLARLRELQAGPLPLHIIRGNNEGYLLALENGAAHPGMYTSRQWGLTRWAWEKLRGAELDWIAALPAQIELDGQVLMVHGSPRRDNEGLVPDRDPRILERFVKARLLDPHSPLPPLCATMEQITQTVLVCGHTHIPWQQREGRKLALNPGSVGAPVNGDPRAQYALLENRADGRGWQVTLRAVPYDIPAVQAAMRNGGLLQAGGGIARAIALDLERADNTVWKFVLHCFDFAEAAGVSAPVIPDELWLAAEKAFPF